MTCDSGRREEWRAIVGYEGLYELSGLGHVRSFYFDPPRPLKHGTDETGYPTIMLSKDGKRKPFTVHRLVALTFHADKRNALHCEVAHLDGDMTNPSADNLKWVSKVENESHKLTHGTSQRGEGNGFSRLTENNVREIRALVGTMSRAQIAAKFGVVPDTITDVSRRRTWAHVE